MHGKKILARSKVHQAEVPGAGVDIGLLLMGAFTGGATLFCGGGAAAAADRVGAGAENDEAELDAAIVTGGGWVKASGWLLPFSFVCAGLKLVNENPSAEDDAGVDWAKVKGWLLPFSFGWDDIDGVPCGALKPANGNPFAEDDADVDWEKLKGWLLLFSLVWNSIDGFVSAELANENPPAGDDVTGGGGGAGSERDVNQIDALEINYNWSIFHSSGAVDRKTAAICGEGKDEPPHNVSLV